MKITQEPLTFACGSEWLMGIVSRPSAAKPRGVLIVVGGPQYRVGSHRQFALLATYLAKQGVAAMRFDYGGMGDSSGELKNFETSGGDIKAAVHAFCAAVPELREVVIWGLCDAASAALFYAHRDARVSGLVLLNPWVRTSEGRAQAYLRHYYLGRLIDPALWRKLLRGEFEFKRSLGSFTQNIRSALGGSRQGSAPGMAQTDLAAIRGPLPERMAEGLARFKGRVLLILSGDDLTAMEFVDVSRASSRWRKMLAAPRVTQQVLAGANHTFSRREWRDQVAGWTAQWLKAW